MVFAVLVFAAPPATLSQSKRRIGINHPGGAFDNGAFECAGANGKILGKETRDRQRRGGIFAEPDRRQCLSCQ